MSCCTVARNQYGAFRKSGSPVSSNLHCAVSANLFSALWENLRARSFWRSVSRWISTESAERSAATLDDVSVMLNDMSGGFSDSDANDVAVKPTGPDVEFNV